MSDAPYRHLPVRPNLDQLRRQAKDLLRAFRRSEPGAVAEFQLVITPLPDPDKVKLADAQFVLARAYQAPNWTRLVQACLLVDAIWNDDLKTVRTLVTKNPQLLHEDALIRKSNWGPPMSYAANVGRDEIIKMLFGLGAKDLETALDRAVLQSKIETARLLKKLGALDKFGGQPPADALGGAAYTISASGTALMLEFGARVRDDAGNRLAPVDVLLETDSRKPAAKHEILELYVRHGLELPDTPTMALHRGRIDLLERHLERDPYLLQRTFTHEEIFPPELGCHDEVNATQGTPLKGTTLLHICADYDEIEIARWLLERGMDPNVKAAVDDDGFGGHTALFGTVVSQPNFWMNYQGGNQIGPFAKLLLDHGTDPNRRASLRKQLHPGYAPKYDTAIHEYRNVTALSWGRRFHAQVFVSEAAMKLIEEHGGIE
ncbi:MAG TPA: hypothetical protein VGN86_03680 [Pyrinomonadaceae bacterium]|nr:hypothetical protein [Pyrinomonadaceae bacterium]